MNGDHSMDDSTTTVFELRQRVRDFVHERDWQKYHNAKDVALSISIEAAELLEHFQWVLGADLDRLTTEPGKREAIEDELADVVIYCLSFANALHIDLSTAVTKKVAKNCEKYPADRVRGTYVKEAGQQL